MLQRKNIAVLYDIENLVGGYNLKYLSEISLKNIIAELDKIDLSNIAVQKAYADWSNNKLNELKWDIAELGIEPIQMYGFSKGNMKNAADIQLVIDAMEILHTKPFIDVFVIVSGDGGFSSLVKKLSEYGKKVVGCAYKSTANEIFTKICDEFIYIENTLTEEQLTILKKINLDENKKKQILENPILKQTLPKFSPSTNYDLEKVKKIIVEFMDKLLENSDANWILKKEGLNISVFKSALNYLFVDFNYQKFGFARLVDFTKYVLNNSKFKLMLKEPSEYRLVLNNVTLSGFEDVGFIDTPPKLHSKNSYINFLTKNKPIIFLPENAENFHKVIDYMLENYEDFKNIFYEDMLIELSCCNVEERELNHILYLLINSDILKGDHISPALREQNYYLSLNTKEDILNKIFETMRNKILVEIDGTIDNNEFEKVLEKFNLKNK